MLWLDLQEESLLGGGDLLARIEALENNLLDALPIGTVMWFKQAPKDKNGNALTNWKICTELVGRYPLGTSDASKAGTTVAAGLPNITGAWAVQAGGSKNGTDAGYGAIQQFKGDTSFGVKNGGGWNDGEYKNQGIKFDASKSNSIYGNSTTVTPPSVQLLPYIKFQ